MTNPFDQKQTHVDPAEVADFMSGRSDPWPDPQQLEPELPDVPEFHVGNLPEVLRPLVEEVAESMQVPPDFPACAAITSLAGCIGHRAIVLPKALDNSWREVCNLWGMNIGSPGLMKTPILKLINRPLESIQRQWNEAHEADEETHERLKQQIKLEMDVYETQSRAAIRANRPQPARPDDHLYAPRERRLIVTDCTFETLHQIMSANAAGVYQLRDELTGFFSGLEREGRQGEREFWLQAWSGDSGFTIDRIGRGSIFVPFVCASLFGNCVPAKLRFYLKSVLSGAATDDGLIQRFQITCWPNTVKTWRYIDRVGSNAAANAAEHVYQSLVRLSGRHPLELRFNPEGQQLFIAWLSALELRLRSETLNPVMAGHVSKFRKLVPVLAGIFELAEAAQRGELETRIIPEEPYLSYARRIDRRIVLEEVPPIQSTGATPISAANTLRAITLCDYFEAHARRVYSCLISPEIRAAHELGRHIVKGDLGTQFSTRELKRKGWTDLKEEALVDAALTHLADLGWIRALPVPTNPQGGRKLEPWEINPKVLNRSLEK